MPLSALSQLAWAHAHETLIWARKGKAARHTFNYDLINSLNSEGQLSSVWRIPTVAMAEKREGYHPTQKPLKLLRRALLASSGEGDLLLDPFCGSGTTAVAAKELGRFFVGRSSRESIASWRPAGSERSRGAACCVRSGIWPLVVAADLEPGMSAWVEFREDGSGTRAILRQ